MKRIKDFFFTIFISVVCFLVIQNAAAPLNDTTTSELKEQIEDLQRNLSSMWKVMEILNNRLEHLEDDEIWHCDEDDNITDWFNIENATKEMEQLWERQESDKTSEKRRDDDDDDDDEDDEDERDDEDDETKKRNDKDESDDGDDSREMSEKNKQQQEGRHRKHSQSEYRGKCRRWMHKGHRRPKMNNEEEHKSSSNITAYCNMRPNKALPPEQRADVRGRIYLVQKGEDKLLMNVKVSGLLPPNGKHVQDGHEGHKHGFHVHEFGNLTNGCESAGTHFNPLNFTHGGPTSTKRHLGDFGNLESDERGIVDKMLEFDVQKALSGAHSLIGRSLVIHESMDDLGSNPEDSESMKSGNSGPRLACCVIHKFE